MEKPLFPAKVMRITQGYGEGTHIDSYAIDNADIDSGKSNIYAPFTGVIKKIYRNDANEVWLESYEKVEYPDGTIDYMTIMFAHNDDVSNLFVGKKIKIGEAFYKEGTKGNVTGAHCHIECGLGKFVDSGWYKNSNGYWSINNGKKPEDCLWVDDSIKILDNYGYNFKKISTEAVEKDKSTSVDDKTNEKVINFKAPTTDLYGIYLEKDQEVKIILTKK